MKIILILNYAPLLYFLMVKKLPFKKSLKILGFNCNKTEQQHFMKMGLTPGISFTLIRTAPFGDPIEISIRNTRVALSKHALMKLRLEVADA